MYALTHLTALFSGLLRVSYVVYQNVPYKYLQCFFL